MEQYVLTLLNNISFNDVNVCNGTLYTCDGDPSNKTPCLTCISCKVIMLVKFTTCLLNHMTDQEIVTFVHDCVGKCFSNDILVSLSYLLSPLDSKDRIYSKSRSRPSLSTDLIDLSLKNFTVNRAHLQKTTSAISSWIVGQQHTFKLHFISSLLSRLKLAVLAEIYRGIERIGKSRDIPVNVSYDFDSDRNIKSQSSPVLRNSNSIVSEEKLTSFIEVVPDFPTDFISMLPVHISKHIMNLLDEASLKICTGISDNWKTIAAQVRREDVVNQKIKEQSMLLQEVSTKPIDPSFARDVDVQIPKLIPGSHQVMYINGFQELNKRKLQKRLSIDNAVDEVPIPISRETFNMEVGYKNLKTKTVIMEERNVYCGAYSVLLLMEGIPKQIPPGTRTIAYNAGDLIAVSGSNKVIQFLDIEGRKTTFTKTKIHGHAGSIKVVRIITKQGLTATKISSSLENLNDGEVLSGSYDTTIRRWDILTGKCLKIYIGHTLTITSLDISECLFVSGSMDGTCKLWNFEDGKCILTMKHKYPVTAVAISMKLIVSGDSFGIIKVWDIQKGNLLKNLIGHSKEITTVRLDSFHILSASLDCYALLWSAVGDFDACIGCFRHPKPVLCMEMMYMRSITGCIDGRIRIWNILTGQCIRIIRGNCRSDPILTMIVNDNRILINTISNILVLNFENVKWMYEHNEEEKSQKSCTRTIPVNFDRRSHHCKHSYQRHERSRFAGNVDPRIFLSPVTTKTNPSLINNSEVIQNSRQFEDGVGLTRASAWLVTPSFKKPVNLDNKIVEIQIERTVSENMPETNQNINDIDDKTRAPTCSSSERRISYGFERQDHLDSNIDLKEMKMTLRKHIRSRPATAIQALPEFVKTMISQMKISSSTGRPVSSFSSNSLTRRSSGPHKINLRSKQSVEEMKNILNPTHSPKENLSPYSQSLENSPARNISKPIVNNVLAKPNIITSAKHCSNRSIIDNFFEPKEWKKSLMEKKKEFDKRHNIVIQLSDKMAKSNSSQYTINSSCNLHLKTFDGSKEYFKDVNKIQYDYEQEELLAKESDKYFKWLKKATEVPCPSYEKDIIKRRPRSAKI